MKLLLFIVNAIIFNVVALICLFLFFVIYNPDDFNVLFLGLVLLIGYSFLTYFYPKKWNCILYHSIFTMIYAGVLFTAPIGIGAVLVGGGLVLAPLVFFIFYLPALLLVIWNIKQIRQYK